MDPSSDLGVTKSAPDTVAADTDMTYTITVNNFGPDDAATAQLTDSLPASTTFVSVSPPVGWSCPATPTVGTNGTVTCVAAPLTAGSISTFSLVVHVDPSASPGSFITNIATVSSDTDPNGENDSSAASSMVAGGTNADVGVTKIVNTNSSLPDRDVVYTITVINNGPDAAASVSLNDTLPLDMTFVSLSSPGGWSCTTPSVGAGGSINCTNANLAVSTGQVFTLSGHIPPGESAATVYANTATVSASTNDPDPDNNSSTVGTTVVTCVTNPIVTTNADSGAGSLRQAILDACADSTITFDMNQVTTPILLTTGELFIDKNLTIQGPGALTVQRSAAVGTPFFRVVNVSSGTVMISGLTISNGSGVDGAIGGPNPGAPGGGIYNAASLTIANCTITGNQTGAGGSNAGATGGVGGDGGGIYNSGTLTILNSTVSNNKGGQGGNGGSTGTGGKGGSGGGIANTGTLTMVNSTISGNQAGNGGNAGSSGTGGVGGDGGAILSETGTIDDCTISGNQAGDGGMAGDNGTASSGQGGGIYKGTVGPVLNIRNSIIDGNSSPTEPDISGTVNSQDYNLIGNTSGATFTGTTTHDIVNLSANLGLLANNGGPTETMLPLPGSPAINAGDPANLPPDTFDLNNNANTTEPLPIDQRGFTRVVGGNFDIGAVETNYLVNATAGTPQSTPINTAFGTQLQATVTESGNPISGITVTFTSPGSGPSGTFPGTVTTANVATNGSGVAIAPVFTANSTAGGPYNVVASIGTGLPSASFALTNEKLDQTISFGPLVNKNFGDPDFMVSASASSGLPVSFTASGQCAVTSPSPGTVHLTGAGSCTITASQAGDATYNPAANVQQSFNIGKADQTIIFGSLPDRNFGDADFMVNPTASSGLPVSLSASGNCMVTSPSPGTVHLTGAGSCTITASQAGDSNYNPAVNVAQSFSIGKANQTITFAPIPNKTFGDPNFIVSPTASSGLPVSLSAISPNFNCLVSTPSPGTVRILSAGSCTITASQAGDVNYNPATNVSQSFSIGKADQFITLDAIPNQTFGNPDFNVFAAASSGLIVNLLASGNCTVSGTLIHLTGAGTCTITASQPGNDNYNAAANLSRTFSIAKANQTITFGPLANKTFGDPDFSVSATASSGLTVSFAASGNCTISSNTVHLTGAGSCTITASQAGNPNFNAAANVSQTFTIAKANQTITFGPLANKTFGDPDFNVSATASSGLTVSFAASGNCTISSNTVHLTGAGSCTITASQAGNANFNAATNVSQSFTIAKANQTITFGALANKTFGNADFNVSATASSGLTVSFAASGNCTISGNTVHITSAGSCTITASQAGDANFNTAPNVSQTFAIAKANTVTSLQSSVNPSNFGQSVTFTATVTSSAGTPSGAVQFKDNGTGLGAPVALNAGGMAAFTTSALTAGTHTITAEYTDASGNFNPSTGSLSQAVQAGISINDVSITEGDSGTKTMTFTVTLSPASNQTVSVNYATANGTATAPSDYLATSGTLTFNPGDLTKAINVTINGDQLFEPDETFTVNLSSPVNTTISKATGIGTILNDDAQGGIISFSQGNYSVSESGGSITITVNRSGDTTRAATVDYTTPDDSSALVVLPCSTASGVAQPRCDFTTALGTLPFAPGETAKTFIVLISQDNFVEGPETLSLTLSNLTGGAVFGSFPTATLTINDDLTEPATNPIDDSANFVRQHYHDFLNREADAAGLQFWTDNINNCTPKPLCTDLQRINTSAAFFLSVEFQQTGYYVYRTYKAGFGDINPPTVPVPVRYRDLVRDTAEVDRGVVVGVGNWQAQLDANKQAFALAFVQRPDFLTRYPNSTTAIAFVNALDTNAGTVLTSAERAALIAELTPNPADPALRADVLMKIAENQLLQQHEFNRAFVLMQYVGYLRRNPDAAPDLDFTGFNFWLNKLNQFNGNYVAAEMVKAFITSSEYRKRFGQ